MTDQVDQDVNQEVHEPSANEVEARTAGWVPKEEYNGDENKWVDADEFVRRGPLFEKINSTTRELKEVRKALDQLKAHHSTVKETAYKEALADLKAQKREAFIDGDPDKIIDIDDQIAAVKEQQRAFDATRKVEVEQAATGEIHPEFAAWTSRNTWYNTSKPMKAYADALGIDLRESGLSPTEVLKRVEIEVKKEFPQKFHNPNRDKASAVEGVGKGGGKTNGGGDGLTELERNIMERFVRQNVMTREQYKAELKKQKEA